jgi:hypothetical protein
VTSHDHDDVLTRATRCLREEQERLLAGGDWRSAAPIDDPTWGRVVGDLRRGRARRRWISMAALQLAIGLGSVGVWAAVTGRLPGIAAGPAPQAAVPVDRASPVRSRRASTRATPAPESAPPPPTPPAPVPSAETAPERSIRARGTPGRSTAAARATDAPAPLAPRAVEAQATIFPEVRAADALYRQAHELHFVHRDFAAALAAWDRYLAADPRPLALEGRWNRAIALVHLERREEAIAALQPFADAAAGSYRQHEARALIDKLQRED